MVEVVYARMCLCRRGPLDTILSYSALDPKVAIAVRANFGRQKFKGKYEAGRSNFIHFDSVCHFLKRTYMTSHVAKRPRCLTT